MPHAAYPGCHHGPVPAESLLRDGLELAIVAAVGGMLWASVQRLRAGRITVPRCPHCHRPTSRAYPACTRCGTAFDADPDR